MSSGQCQPAVKKTVLRSIPATRRLRLCLLNPQRRHPAPLCVNIFKPREPKAPASFFPFEQTFFVICHLFFQILHTRSRLYALSGKDTRTDTSSISSLSLGVSPLFALSLSLCLCLVMGSPSRLFLVGHHGVFFFLTADRVVSVGPSHQPRVHGQAKRGMDRRNCAGVATPPHTAVPLA